MFWSKQKVEKARIRIDFDASISGYRELAEAIADTLRDAGYTEINLVKDREDDKRNLLLLNEQFSASADQVRAICERLSNLAWGSAGRSNIPFFDDIRRLPADAPFPYGDADIMVSINRHPT